MVLPLMEKQYEVVAQDPRNVKWPVYSVPTMALPELAPHGGSILEMFVPLAPEVAHREWTEAEKQEIIESTLQPLRRRHALQIAVTVPNAGRFLRPDAPARRGTLRPLASCTASGTFQS
jgi:phytoene desaturase